MVIGAGRLLGPNIKTATEGTVPRVKLGILGLGKLGMPVAVALDAAGHDVVGHDLLPERMTKDRYPHRERGLSSARPFADDLRASGVTFGTLEQVVAHAAILFVAVQTPHDPEFEGHRRLPQHRADFDYSLLETALAQVARICDRDSRHLTVFIISTVLPGTLRPRILTRTTPYLHIAYNPFFIAMGQVIEDFRHPEFVLIGSDDPIAIAHAHTLYATLHDAPVLTMSVESAEAAKLAYNSFITAKITLANAWMEVCHRTGGNVDDVTRVLAAATGRITSAAYLRGGMGDGGGCHPRDNIALSSFARSMGLSYDVFGTFMEARERQTDWLAALVCGYPGPKVVLGRAFKAGTGIETGSAAVLLAGLLRERTDQVRTYEPHTDPPFEFTPAVYVIATRHPEWHAIFRTGGPPAGSVVIDPWRSYRGCFGADVRYVPVGCP